MKTKTYKVKPINSIESVRNEYDYVYSYITNQTVPLETVSGEKEVQIVKYDKTMTTEEILADMKEKGLQPASPNALLGFMHDFPDVLEKYQWLVAASSVFQGGRGDRCFLGVFRLDGGRGLRLVNVDDDWDAGLDWLFLAEPLNPNTDTVALGHSDTSVPKNITVAIELLKKEGFTITKIY